MVTPTNEIRRAARLWLAVPIAVLTLDILSDSHRVNAEEPEADRGTVDVEGTVDFKGTVRPLLAGRCMKCHGGVKREGRLSFSTRDDALATTQSGRPAIVPGKPMESELLRRITLAADSDPDGDRMPPRGERLSAQEVGILRSWIRQGADFAEHWAFEPPRPVEPPRLEGASESQSGIDRFVGARLLAEGLRPAPRAPRHTLIRRLSLDLTGLPPSPDEVARFVGDASSSAYENLVDRVLASPHFGERWARVWLDMARYADTQGFEKDNRRTIWRYRDWVISAFDEDLPFDRFTIAQLAGDLLPDPSLDDLIATAFHRNTMTNTEGGTDDEEFRSAAIIDRVSTTWQVWLGTTFGCVQCHNHPFDPFTHDEFYRFFAFLNNTEDNDQPDERPTIPSPTPGQIRRLEAIDAEIASLRGATGDAESEASERIAQLEKKRGEIEPPTTPILRELPDGKKRATHIFLRGSFLSKGERVEAAVPKSLHAWPESAPRNRLGMARWIVDPDNPLTARVTVNRFWEQLFGRGLVETSEDFGTQGAQPTHPDLLDWLAQRLIHVHRWSVKALLRDIVLSETYQRSSRATPELLERDPRNILLGRAPRFRLDAETIRDQALAVSGLLDRQRFGPSVMPPQPDGVWQVVYSGDRWVTSAGSHRYRRGLYTFWRRTSPYPSMIAFDAVSREYCVVRRVRTNTPLQALVTLNDPVFVEAAQGLARRIVRSGEDEARARAKRGFRIALARPPTEREALRVEALYSSELEHYRERPEEARKMACEPRGPPPEGVDVAELAAWTVVANVLMNLDEFLTRN